VEALEVLGCRDRDLHLLAERLRGVHAVEAYPLQGSGG